MKSSFEAQAFLYFCLHMNCRISLKDIYNEIISYIPSKLRILHDTIPRIVLHRMSGYMVMPQYKNIEQNILMVLLSWCLYLCKETVCFTNNILLYYLTGQSGFMWGLGSLNWRTDNFIYREVSMYAPCSQATLFYY